MQDSLSCHCTPFPKWPANTWTTSLRKTGPANSRFFVSRPIDLGPNSKLADRSLAGFQMQPHPSNWFLFWLPPRWHNNPCFLYKWKMIQIGIFRGKNPIEKEFLSPFDHSTYPILQIHVSSNLLIQKGSELCQAALTVGLAGWIQQTGFCSRTPFIPSCWWCWCNLNKVQREGLHNLLGSDRSKLLLGGRLAPTLSEHSTSLISPQISLFDQGNPHAKVI